MLPLSPALFIAAASALVSSDDITLDTMGDDPLLRDKHGAGDARATAAFIGVVGYASHRPDGGRSVWPFPIDAGCNELARLAGDRKVLSSRWPERGAIYLRYSLIEQRFTRASIVLSAKDVMPHDGVDWSYDCLVVEGSAVLTPMKAEGEKPSVKKFTTQVLWARRARVMCCPSFGDRVISWVDLDGRNPSMLPWSKAG